MKVRELKKPSKKICIQCHSTYHTKYDNQQLCSSPCRKLHYGGKYGRKKFHDIPTPSIGTISEMMICSDLLKRGYCVFKTVSNASFCDIIAIKGDELMSIECRTGYADTKGNISFPKQIHNKVSTPTHYGIFVPMTNQITIRAINQEELDRYCEVKKNDIIVLN